MNVDAYNQIKAEAPMNVTGTGSGKLYNVAFKKKVVEYIAKGYMTKLQAAEAADCQEVTIYSWIKTYKDKAPDAVAVRRAYTPVAKRSKPLSYIDKLVIKRHRMQAQVDKLTQAIDLLREIDV